MVCQIQNKQWKFLWMNIGLTLPHNICLLWTSCSYECRLTRAACDARQFLKDLHVTMVTLGRLICGLRVPGSQMINVQVDETIGKNFVSKLSLRFSEFYVLKIISSWSWGHVPKWTLTLWGFVKHVHVSRYKSILRHLLYYRDGSSYLIALSSEVLLTWYR